MPNDTATRVTALSLDGAWAAGVSSGASARARAVLWDLRTGAIQALSPRLGTAELLWAEPLAVADGGERVVGWGQLFDVGTPLALHWQPGRPTTSLADGLASALSRDGATVVGTFLSGGESALAFRWSAGGGLTLLERTEPGTLLVARAISHDGQVVVGSETTNSASLAEPREQAFRWTRGGGPTRLGVLPGGTRSLASATDEDGSVVVGLGDGATGWTLFQWRAREPIPRLESIGAAMPPTCVPPSPTSNGLVTVCTGLPVLSQHASVVAGQGEAGATLWDLNTGRATLLSEALAATLPAGWRLAAATGLSANGRIIVGNGVSPTGEARGWQAIVGPACEHAPGATADGGLDTEDASTGKTAAAAASTDGGTPAREATSAVPQGAPRPDAG